MKNPKIKSPLVQLFALTGVLSGLYFTVQIIINPTGNEWEFPMYLTLFSFAAVKITKAFTPQKR